MATKKNDGAGRPKRFTFHLRAANGALRRARCDWDRPTRLRFLTFTITLRRQSSQSVRSHLHKEIEGAKDIRIIRSPRKWTQRA